MCTADLCKAPDEITHTEMQATLLVERSAVGSSVLFVKL